MNYELIKHNIIQLEEQHDNAVAVMAGAYFAAQEVHNDTPNFEAFINYLFGMIQNAKFFKWHESIPNAMRTFCHLAMVDPMLVEAYIGFRFEELMDI